MLTAGQNLGGAQVFQQNRFFLCLISGYQNIYVYVSQNHVRTGSFISPSTFAGGPIRVEAM